MGKKRITMDLDETLLITVDTIAAERKKSRNQFIIESVERMLRELERKRVDAAFARIVDDAEYQAELLRMEREMSPASDATWRMLDAAEHGETM
jgi:metal-responsive CopG/Arc/MetJ family transcriptional regulator